MKTCLISNLSKNETQPITYDLGTLLLRLTLAVAIWPHGAQKVLGWFGGYGFSGTYNAFTEGMGLWAPLALAAILTEFLAPLFLVMGLFTRLAAFACTVLMLVAMSFHTSNGFFANWDGKQAGEGIEYHLLFSGTALALALIGSGRFSLDRLIIKRFFCEK